MSKKSTDKIPQLRAIAVIEWTGEAGKPKASRIVPVSIFDGEHLQDAGLYLARPEPLALAGEVEYELKQNGHTVGLFDIKNSGQEEGSWVGYGEWKPAPVPKTESSAPSAKIDDDYSADDKPVLHRKQKSDSTSKSGGGSSAPASPAGSDDPDRPTMHKKTDDSGSSGSSSGNPSGTGSDSSAENTPDRPVMKKPKKSKAPEDIGRVDSVAGFTDPDRPHLKRGLSNAESLKVLPSLMGLPPDMQQAVAVSDLQNRPDHPWSYSWANPADEAKMKAQMEDIARLALGISHPAPPVAQAKAGAAHHAVTAKKAAPAVPAHPAPLEEEQFRVFELAYGSGATMVLTAQTPGPLAQQRFVTLIAQPDLYGNVMVLLKYVTDGAHLDDNPRMRLVDAVDALADNRGELLFELRGETSRQFALYRVLRGSAEKVFESFGGNYGTPIGE